MPKNRSERWTSSTASTDRTGCPFFKSHSQSTIVCEGVIPDTRVVERFRCAQEKRTHKDIFCDGHWECCEMHRSIMRYKYLQDWGEK